MKVICISGDFMDEIGDYHPNPYEICTVVSEGVADDGTKLYELQEYPPNRHFRYLYETSAFIPLDDLPVDEEKLLKKKPEVEIVGKPFFTTSFRNIIYDHSCREARA